MRSRSVYLPDDLWEALERIGSKQDRSTNWLIRRAVQEYLEKQKR
jgi:predicted transcriptional regulator